MFVGIQNKKIGEHIESTTDEEGNRIDIIVPEFGEHKASIAETREELENQDDIQYERIDEYEFAKLFGGIIYTDENEYIKAKNQRVKSRRAKIYAKLIDPLHAEKLRKMVLGTWTEKDETEYVNAVKSLTEQIQNENPYVE